MNNEMDIELTYDQNDWAQFQGHLTCQLSKHGKSIYDGFFVNVVIWALIAVLALYVARRTDILTTIHWPTAGFTAAAFVILFVFFIRFLNRISKAYAPAETGCFLDTHQFRLTESGIESRGTHYNAFHAWPAAQKLERENGMIMVYLDTANALIFPEAKLDDPDGVYEYIRAHMTTAQGEAGD